MSLADAVAALPVTGWVVDSVASTQTALAKRVEAGAPLPALLVANRQSAGIGRHGKAFTSPAAGLYFTYACPLPATPLVTPAAGVAMQAALQAVTGVTTEIKWVNDLLLADAKCVGILATTATTPSGPAVLIGCGVNLTRPLVAAYPDALPAGGLFASAPATDPRGAIIAAWVTHFTHLLANPAQIMPAYRAHAAWLGRRVRVRPSTTTLTGTLTGFGADGSAILTTANGPVRVSTGSMRLAEQNRV